METVSGAATPNKRERHDTHDNRAATRKRMRYVAQACEQCKRQKVRCNGLKPCNRCERLRPLECCYQTDRNPVTCLECGHDRKDSVTEVSKVLGPDSSAPDNLRLVFVTSVPLDPALHRTDRVSQCLVYSNDPLAIKKLLSLLQTQTGKLDVLLERTDLLSSNLISCSSVILHEKPSQAIPATGLSTGKSDTKNPIPTAVLHPQPPPLPTFHGPTSSSYLIDVALMLVTQGKKNKDPIQLAPEIVEHDTSSDSHPAVTEDTQYSVESKDNNSTHVEFESFALTENGKKLSLDPLQKLNEIEVVRLLRLYDDLVQSQYPFLEMELLIQQAKELYKLLQPQSATKKQSHAPMIGMDVDSVRMLKLVLAIALLLEGKSHASLAEELYKSLADHVKEMMWAGVNNMEGLALVVLTVSA